MVKRLYKPGLVESTFLINRVGFLQFHYDNFDIEAVDRLPKSDDF